jgi:hypothetical protein
MFKKMIITNIDENKFITDSPEKSVSPGSCGCGSDCACKQENKDVAIIDNKEIIKSLKEKSEGGCGCGCGCN